MWICWSYLAKIVLDDLSLISTSFGPRCLTTWLKESVRGVHKTEHVESRTVRFKFIAWVTDNSHACPTLPKQNVRNIRCKWFSSQMVHKINVFFARHCLLTLEAKFVHEHQGQWTLKIGFTYPYIGVVHNSVLHYVTKYPFKSNLCFETSFTCLFT